MLQPTSVLRTALFVGLLVLPLHVAAAQESARETRSVEAFTAVGGGERPHRARLPTALLGGADPQAPRAKANEQRATEYRRGRNI